jgi:hypothetical protein
MAFILQWLEANHTLIALVISTIMVISSLAIYTSHYNPIKNLERQCNTHWTNTIEANACLEYCSQSQGKQPYQYNYTSLELSFFGTTNTT